MMSSAVEKDDNYQDDVETWPLPLPLASTMVWMVLWYSQWWWELLLYKYKYTVRLIAGQL